VFLDLDDIGAGERWKDALRQANARCEAIILLASPEALSSVECLTEVRTAENFGKEILVVLLRDLGIEAHRLDSLKDRQIVDLAAPPLTHIETISDRGEQHQIRFSGRELVRIKDYLIKRGITPDRFAWPPKDRPKAEPFPGLSAFTEDDAGIFFGRDADILHGLDRLRVLRRNGRPRLLIIQAASGAGKSSYLRAGLWPRLNHDPDFAPLAILRPAQGILTSPEGLAHKLAARSHPASPVNPGDISPQLMADDLSKAVEEFSKLIVTATTQAHEQRRIGDRDARPPAPILAIDQAEELFRSEDTLESQRFLYLLACLIRVPPAGVDPLAMMTIRGDSVDVLFKTIADLGVEVPETETLQLLPLPRTSYRDVIVKPLELLSRRGQKLTISPAFADRLVADATGADALPLLAFTLSRLYQGFSARGSLTLDEYETMGGIAGSIDMALKQALKRPSDAPAIPAARDEQLAVLRATFIPWLARIDPHTGVAMRRVARLDEFPQPTRAMVKRLIEARLLVVDRHSGADTVELAHESLLRQWPELAAWLEADADDLRLVEGVERAAAEWVRNGRLEAWLDHRAERLIAADRAANRDDFRRRLDEKGIAYLSACRARAQARTAILQRSAFLVATVVLVALTLLRAIDPTAVSELRERTFDTYQRLQPRANTASHVRVVDIDEQSLKVIGPWPWPRTLLAALVKRLRNLGAVVIAFDMVFAESDRTTYSDMSVLVDKSNDPDAPIVKAWLARQPGDFDKTFAMAVQQSPVVLGLVGTTTQLGIEPPIKAEIDYDEASPTSVKALVSGVLSNLTILDNAATGIGFIGKGVANRQTMEMVLSDGSRIYPALVVETLRVAQKQRSILIHGTGANGALLDLRVGNFRVPLSADGKMWLYYDYDQGTRGRYISAEDVLHGQEEADLRSHVDGKIVFIGTSAVGLANTIISPWGQPVPEVGVLAQAAEQIIGHAYLTRPDLASGVEIVATFLLGALLGLMILTLDFQLAAVIGLTMLGVMAIGAWLAFSYFGLLFDPIYPLLAAVCVFFSVATVLYFATDSEKKLIRQTFAQYFVGGWKAHRD
jgi:CHASE2 domain-containing sensor protein